MRLIASLAAWALLAASPAFAQDVVKIGQIEAQTGPNAIYGWMGSQGVPMAVDEINKAGGFKVGDKTYKLELISPDTRGDPEGGEHPAEAAARAGQGASSSSVRSCPTSS